MTNKEKFMLLVSDRPSGTVERNKERIKNRAMLRESRKIAYKVLVRLDVLGWSQKRLADEMGVSAQYISKVVQGKENLTLDTLIKLQNILDIPLLASHNEDKDRKIEGTNRVVVSELTISSTITRLTKNFPNKHVSRRKFELNTHSKNKIAHYSVNYQ